MVLAVRNGLFRRWRQWRSHAFNAGCKVLQVSLSSGWDALVMINRRKTKRQTETEKEKEKERERERRNKSIEKPFSSVPPITVTMRYCDLSYMKSLLGMRRNKSF